MSHLITCPECQKHLQVPDDLAGKTVQCPECQHTFTAEGIETEVITSNPKKPPTLPVPTKKGPPRETQRSEDEERESESPRRRSRRDDEDDDDYERPSRRRTRSRGNYAPHRGGLILAFGIIGLVSGLGIIFGPIAWFMGNADLREISEGRMDPEGESMTQTGRILGMIAAILSIVGILISVGFFGVFFGCACCLPFMAAANNPNNPNFRPPRR